VRLNIFRRRKNRASFPPSPINILREFETIYRDFLRDIEIRGQHAVPIMQQDINVESLAAVLLAEKQWNLTAREIDLRVRAETLLAQLIDTLPEGFEEEPPPRYSIFARWFRKKFEDQQQGGDI
jgi:hypothetical protein